MIDAAAAGYAQIADSIQAPNLKLEARPTLRVTPTRL